MGPYLDIWAFIWKMGLKVDRVGSCVDRVGFYLNRCALTWTYVPFFGRWAFYG